MGLFKLNEIEIANKLEFQQLKMLFEHYQIASAPYYIDLTKFREIDREEILNKLQRVANELMINPRFPYPCYVITGKRLNPNKWTFPLCDNLEQLPNYYQKARSGKKKESGFSARITTYCEKLLSLQLTQKIELIKDKLKSQDGLYLSCMQMAHIERLLQKRIRRRK